MSLSELLAAIEPLSRADKFRLVQIVLQQVALEEGINLLPASPFDPRLFFGAGQATVMPRKSLRGALKHHANSAPIDKETTAWLDTVQDQDEHH